MVHNEAKGAKPISNWKLPCNIDAAYYQPDTATTYFIKGKERWKWSAAYLGKYWAHDSGVTAAVKYGKSGMIFKEKVFCEVRWDRSKCHWKDMSSHSIWRKLSSSMLLPKCNCDCSNLKSDDSDWVVADRNSIKFETDKGEVIPGERIEMGSQEIDDRHGMASSTEDYADFTASKTLTYSKSFQTSGGITLSLGAEFTAGVPGLAEGKVSTSLETSVSFSSTAENTETETVEQGFRCHGIIGIKVRCEVTSQKKTLRVPFTMKLRHKQKGCICETSGIYVSNTYEAMTMIRIKEA